MSAHILVVEDEPDMLDFLELVLKREGHTVVTAPDGEAALRHLAERELDVVLSDVRMPGVTGLDVLRALKERAPQTEAIMTTGYADVETAVECLRAGAFDFVQKPINLFELLSTVMRAIERRQLRAATQLYQASQAIFSTSEAARLPERIVETAVKVMGADDASLLLPGADGDLYVAHSCGLSPEIGAQVRLALGERVAGRIALDRTPALLASGLASDPRFAALEDFGRVQSSIVYPLLAGDRLVGVLNLNRTTPGRPFRHEDLERTSVLAAQILLALENARLVRQMVTSERLASIGQLAAGIAHEINSPIHFVLSSLEYLQDAASRGAAACSAEPLRQAIADAVEGATRIRDIAQDMRSLAQIGAPPEAVCNVNAAIRSALRIAGPELRGRARVVTQLGEGALVRGSAGRLSQVFVNLLVNAAQAFAERPVETNEVTVVSRREGGRVLARFHDNGPGVPAEHLGRLFEPFFTTKGRQAGTGLGLYISREIVRAHGGTIEVESSPDRGTAFTIVLPSTAASLPADGGHAEDRPASTAPPAPPGAGQAPAEKPRVLFIDDEPALLRAYARAFSQEYHVDLAESAADALARVAEGHELAAILCDIHIGEHHGVDLYERICSLAPRLADRFVFTTGSLRREEEEALRARGHTIVSKLCDDRELRALLAERVATARGARH